MATGPEHYRIAEQLLGGDHGSDPCWVAAAQVHATLALAAATAMQHYNFETGMHTADRNDWYRTVSQGPADKARLRAAEAAEDAEAGLK